MRILIRLVLVLAAFFSLSSAQAAFSPLGLAILSPVEFPPPSFSITGVRLSAFWGDNHEVYGLDLGAIGNVSEHNFVGLGVSGVFNYNRGVSTIVGLQAAGITNVNVDHAGIAGLQIAAIANANLAESTLIGLGVSVCNYMPHTDIWGAQVGVYNSAKIVNGFQLGLVNVADSLHGIQIGLVNFNRTGLFFVTPFLNIGF